MKLKLLDISNLPPINIMWTGFGKKGELEENTSQTCLGRGSWSNAPKEPHNPIKHNQQKGRDMLK
jgi:hypothetical protein